MDRWGSFRVGTAGAVLMAGAVWLAFIDVPPHPKVLLLFLFFMFALSVRNVSYSTLTSKVPTAAERARFMSFQSAVQHLSSAAGAFLSTLVLAEGPGGRLLHVRRLAALSLLLTAALPSLLFRVERAVGRGQDGTPPAQQTDTDLGPPSPGMAQPLKKV